MRDKYILVCIYPLLDNYCNYLYNFDNYLLNDSFYSIFKYPLTTKSAMKKIEDNNTLVFIVMCLGFILEWKRS